MKLSVVIVTKNRAKDLKHCLGSLATQTKMLDELVVVDNDSTDETKALINTYKKTVRFPVKYLLEKANGYPVIYNTGLKKSSYDWVAFIDDDCVADAKWYESFFTAVNKNRQVSAILGFSGTYYPNNIFSVATHVFKMQWKKSCIDGTNIRIFEVLENQNIVYNKNFLKSHDLRYDESRINKFNGAAEDSDLGMAIQEVGGKAIYEKNAIIWHKDPTSFGHYFKKYIFSFYSNRNFQDQWTSKIPDKKNVTTYSTWLHGRKMGQFSVWQNLSYSLVFFMTVLLQRIFLPYYYDFFVKSE